MNIDQIVEPREQSLHQILTHVQLSFHALAEDLHGGPKIARHCQLIAQNRIKTSN